MKRIISWISNHSKLIIIISLLLLIPSIIGIKKTKINYDILVYLPEDIETMRGQDILTDDFEIGAFAFVTVKNKNAYNIESLENEIRLIPKVSEVISINDFLDLTIPKEMLPQEILTKVYHEDETVIAVTFKESTSHDDTLKGIEEIRKIVKDESLVSGMTSTVLDTKDISIKEMFAYIIIATIFCLIVLTISTDSYIIPIILLVNIGISILYNMGTNIFLGEISYITKAIAAVLQLGVTMDFSIFLYHKYEHAKTKEKDIVKAMELALKDTVISVVGSSLTTIAGFLALCFMNLTLGKDIGLVMAKGVVCGLISAFTLLPSLLITFDKLIRKTKHKVILPEFKHLQKFALQHQKLIIIIFIILLIPAIYGNHFVKVYYNLDESLPSTLPSSIANKNLKENFNLVSPEILILNKNIKKDTLTELVNKIKEVNGIDLAIAPKEFLGEGIPKEMLPKNLSKLIESEKYQIIIINSIYKTATKELNEQVDIINKIAKDYDSSAILAGEGPLMKDLTEISDTDFRNVNFISIAIIFIIMIFVLKSFTLPVILVATIEFAIFLNMSVAFYTNNELPFIASIIIGTIQLGATIDYAILMTSKFTEEINKNKTIEEAMEKTLKETVPSVITSALCFFAATIGVSIYSKIDLIGSICKLISRGSIISMLVVLTILPAFLMLYSKFIRNEKKKEGNKMSKKIVNALILFTLCFTPFKTNALQKNETIYTTLNSKGNVLTSKVTNHLSRFDTDKIKDETELKNILNINNEKTFNVDGNTLTFDNYGKDIFYEGTTEKELPLNINVTYYLNGEEKELKDIYGKEGKVTIKIAFENKLKQVRNISGHLESMYTPFVITAGTIIKNDNNWNISVNNGKTVSTGTKNIVLGLAASGVYESLNEEELKDLNNITITYETKKMTFNEIYLVITPKMIESNDLKIFNKLDEAYSNVNLLQKNMNKIVDGTKELEKGASKLKNGSKELSDALNNVVSNLNSITNGSTSLEQGLLKAQNSITNAKNMLSTSVDSKALLQIETLKKQNIITIDNLQSSNQSLKSQYDNYNLQSLTPEQILTLELDEQTKTNLITLKKTYEANIGLITLLNTNNEALDKTILNIKTLLNNATTLINGLEQGLNDLHNGSLKLNNGLQTLSNGLNKIYGGSKELTNGTFSLYDGTKTLQDGINKYNEEGINVLNKTANNLKIKSDKVKELVNLSKEYKGYASNNSDEIIFIYKIESEN